MPGTQTPKYRCALALMARIPEPGVKEKSRFSPALTPTEAAALKVSFLRDMAATIGDVVHSRRGEGVIVCGPIAGKWSLKEIIPEGFKVFTQTGAQLGDILENAAEDLIKRGFPSVCLINPDSPTLPRHLLEAAIETLDRPGERLVLGPTDGGGGYLIGLKQSPKGLFDRVLSSGANLVAHMTARAAEIGLRVEMLPAWYEVNDPRSLSKLCNELFGSVRRTSLRRRDSLHLAPYTRRYLTELLEGEASGRIRQALSR